MIMEIAVLLATYNRRQKTVACLESLKAQLLPEGIYISLYLTDDASSDGTVEAVKTIYPDANIFNGGGKLFWAGGMRSSWQEAIKSNADFFLLLNDDTILIETALATLLNCNQNVSKSNSIPAVCIGSTMDKNSGTLSYGGRNIGLNNRIDKNYVVFSETEYLECDLGNANIMLVPKAVVEKIGILSSDYTHSIADYDYTLRAKKAGFKVIVAPGILGYCVNDHVHSWVSQNHSLKERINYLKSPKGLAYKEYLTFIRSHFPSHLPFAFCKLWMKTFFPFIWEIKKRKVYKKSSFS